MASSNEEFLVPYLGQVQTQTHLSVGGSPIADTLINFMLSLTRIPALRYPKLAFACYIRIWQTFFSKIRPTCARSKLFA